MRRYTLKDSMGKQSSGHNLEETGKIITENMYVGRY